MKRSAGIVYRVDALKAVSARSGAFWGVLVDVLGDDDDTEGGNGSGPRSASPCVVMGRRHAGAVGGASRTWARCSDLRSVGRWLPVNGPRSVFSFAYICFRLSVMRCVKLCWALVRLKSSFAAA